jgi:carboxypeptidase T
MKKIYSILLILFLSTTIFSENYKQVKIFIEGREQINTLVEQGLEFDHLTIEKDNSIITFISDSDFEKLKMMQFNYEILIDDWNEYYANLPALSTESKNEIIKESKENYGVEGLTFGSMGGFYTFAEITANLDSMFAHYPNLITQKYSIGTSHEGRTIWAVKISDNPNVAESEPQVLFESLIHAREPASMATVIYYMYYLLENYGTDLEVTYLVNNREIYFVPCFNPDGYEYNRINSPSGGGMWRKNRRNSGGGDYGVDLNRNFGYEWGYDNIGSSPTPSSETYRGPSAFSEPESQAIRDFITPKNIKTHINYHSYGNVMIYPWGYTDEQTPDSNIYNSFTADMSVWNGYGYGNSTNTIGYQSNGTVRDWSYGEQTVKNKIFGYVFEVGASSDGFWPSQSRIFPLAQGNLRPNLYNTWVAGGYAGTIGVTANVEHYNPGDNVLLTPIVKNKGLGDAENLTIELTSLSPDLTVVISTTSLASIPSLTVDTSAAPVEIAISGSAAIGSEVQLVWSVTSNSVLMSADTTTIRIGTPVYLFEDNSNDPAVLWNLTGTQTWEAITSSFYSSPNSYTESKFGNYSSNSSVVMTLQDAIDLTSSDSPVLTFWTKYFIEDNWDCGQVYISTNSGSTWIPQAGSLTVAGSGNGTQVSGQPVYEGTKSNWAYEEIDLAAYEGEQILIRFEFKSDSSVEEDGWYVDDIKIYFYGVVPVELISFNASVENSSVNLNWKTASELNNYGFRIEKSVNKVDWQQVAFVDGRGTTSEVQSYSITDKIPLIGKSLYRLTQIDFDGTKKIIATEEVNFVGNLSYSLEQNYPNPFNPSTKIKYSIKTDAQVKLTIYNLMGEVVGVLVNEPKEAGEHEFIFNTQQFSNSISSGVYFYTINAGDYSASRKMMILK